MDLEIPVDLLDVGVNGVWRDPELDRDLGVGQPVGDQYRDAALGGRQAETGLEELGRALRTSALYLSRHLRGP